MINEGGFLEGPAMRSSGAATGTPSRMPACSISTTTGPTTATTTSASADPRIDGLDAGHAHGRSFLGRETPDAPASKARQHAQPKTAAGPKGAAAGSGIELGFAYRESGADFFRLTSLDNLFACWHEAKRNKGSCLRVQRFAADPLHYLSLIQQRLRDRVYQFGPYRSFTVQEKKFRHVIDAPMKDRVVHWMLYQYLLPIWQPRFIHDTYGNLPGRGTHAAVARLADFCRRPAHRWVLQLDISKYFHSVDHALLKACAWRYIGDHDLRLLIGQLIDSYRTDERYDELFAAGSHYRQTPAKGMPIGNLTSQLLANVFLADFDHWVKQSLQVRGYIRYVDDLVILGEDRDSLRAIGAQIVERLDAQGLTVHPKKIRLAPIAAGVPFLGYVVWPQHVSAGAYLRRRYHQRLRQHEAGSRDRNESLLSYRAALSHTGPTH